MWFFRRPQIARRLRLEALREMYRRNFGENSAEARGLRLLREWLSPSQREQFDTLGYFEVIGCNTGSRYRLYYGKAMNVHELDESGRLKMGWCFVPDGPLAAGDVLLSQKIALETFECDALSVAKRFVPNHVSRN
jgi:hypothetical protein